MPRREDLWWPTIDHDRLLPKTPLEVRDPEAHRRLGVVEQVTQTTVAVGPCRRSTAAQRLALGHDLHERVLRHRLQRIVPTPLLTDRRRHRIGQ
jgi:hypothetical protein